MKNAARRHVAHLLCAALAIPLSGQTRLPEPSAALQSGLSLLDTGDTLGAFAVFEAASGCDSALADCRALQACAAMLRPGARRLAAKQSLSGAAVSDVAVNRNSLACAPFVCTGAPNNLRPLATGFAEMLSTDFAHIERFTVCERAQMRALAHEAALAQSGVIDSSHHGKLGRLLGAHWVIAGSYRSDGTSLSVSASVRRAAGTDSLAGTASVSGPVSRLFKLEKELVFALCRQWGIVLTSSEQKAIETVPTENVLAYLAYCKGLDAEDAGNFPAASRHYGEAVRHDPKFTSAQDANRRTKKALEGQNMQRRKAAGPSAAGRGINTAVFTIGAIQISGAGSAAVAGMNNVMAGFMPERPYIAASGGRVSSARVSAAASARQPLRSERNSYIDATNRGANSGSSVVPVRIPLPPTLGN